MSKNNNETLAQEQRRTKPKLEDVIASSVGIADEAKQAVFAFLDYCNAKNIAYRWSSTNQWNLHAKGKSLGYIRIGKTWVIQLNHREIIQYVDFMQKEGLSETIYNNLYFCDGCNGEGHCVSCTGKLRLQNPDAQMIVNIQKIVDFWLTLPSGTGSRPILDPITNGLTRIDNKSHISSISDLHGNTNGNRDSLFNGKCNSYFFAGPYSHMSIGNSHEIVFELDEPTELKMYSLVTGLRLDVPIKWTLYGATSKEEPWMLLDEQDQFPKPVTLYTEKAFAINTPKTYQYYRITFEGRNFVLSQVYLYTK